MHAREKAEFHVLLILIVKSYKENMLALLIDTIELGRLNATTVGGAIMRRLTEMGINFDQVNGFVSNGARNMTACYLNTIKSICQKVVHIACTAHVIYLIREMLSKKSSIVD